MIDLKRYRIVDLSIELLPGERKIDGRYLHGEPLWGRPIEVQEFIAYGARMHFIQGQTHSGTHVEATYKYSENGADMASMPIESYIGEAVVCDFSVKKAGESVSSEDFLQAGVKPGDIVLAWASPETPNTPPFLAVEATDWLIATKIKLLGIENLNFSPPGTAPGAGDADYKLHLAGIPQVDCLQGLARLKRKRVFFIALPVRLRRVTATWTRAVALEEI
jgi:arylformamidase